MADASGNNANYGGGDYPIDSGKFTTVAGEFQNSDSPYGTFDQGGNVWEWNEAIVSGAFRGLRGGKFYYDDYYLRASVRVCCFPTTTGDDFGFRVSAVPEPASVLVLGSGILALAGMIRRRRNG